MSYRGFSNYVNTLSVTKAITGSQYVVKCFNAAGFDQVFYPSGKHRADILLAGDSRKAKEIARLIARDIWYAECHDFGGSDSVALLDEMAICYYHLSSIQNKVEKVPVKISKR